MTNPMHRPETDELREGPLDAAEPRRRLTEFVTEAWSQALLAVNTAEDDVQRIVGRVAHWVEMRPDETRRLVVDLAERLRSERAQLENAIETAIVGALAPLRLPTRDDLALLDQRLRSLEARLAALAASRQTDQARPPDA